MKKLKSIYRTVFLTVLILFISGCKDFTNKPAYKIRPGETFNLYITENSCCINCPINTVDLHSIELVDEKLADPADQDCDGCTSIYAIVFKGIKVGVDTIKLNHISAGDQCSDSIPTSDFIVVTVSQ